MALSEKERNQLLFVVVPLVAVGVIALFWVFWRGPTVERAGLMRVRIDSLQARVDSARRDLAAGTVEALRRRVRDYEASLQLMRQLVPTGAEVPTLIDDVTSRARRRGVEIAEITPLGLEAGAPFRTDRYRLVVLGRYDQIGEFLTDVASLPRIMVPSEVAISRALASAAATYGDTTGNMLQVNFQLRTFVKTVSDGPPGGGR